MRATVCAAGAAGAAFAFVCLLAGSAGAEHGTPGTVQLVTRPDGATMPTPGVANASLVASAHAASANGRFVVFSSQSDGLSSQDDDSVVNVFVRDAQTGAVTLVDRASGAAGAPAHSDAAQAVISADGTHVAFSTAASLDPADTNGKSDVYVRDLVTNTTTLVSRASGGSGAVGNGSSSDPSIDADGGRVAFTSGATNLVPGDTNSKDDVFTYDIPTQTTELISRASTSAGALGDGASYEPSISDDGTRIAFATQATNLGGSPPARPSVYMRDIGGALQPTTLESESSGGTPANGGSILPSISGDGKSVAFESTATNLDPADTNFFPDVYVRSLVSPTTTLVSRADGPSGAAAGVYYFAPSISTDGSKIAFVTATNLSGADTNSEFDVYVRALSGTTTLVSRAPGPLGAVGDGYTLSASISGDGGIVYFASTSTNFGNAPSPDFQQVYARNLITSTTTFVSHPPGDPSFVAADDGAYDPGIPEVSADGRFVVFASDADNLSSEDDNRYTNIFVRDTLLDKTTLVSRASGPNGAAATGPSYAATISADGTTVAFGSWANNIVPGDTAFADVFVRNLATGQTTRVASSSGSSFPGELTPDGKILVFYATGEVIPGISSTHEQVYVKNLVTGDTVLVSRATGAGGTPGDADSDFPTISADGTKVAFRSTSTNLVTGITTEQFYVRDLTTNATMLASRGNAATPPDGNALEGVLDPKGDLFAFASKATNLVPGDLNAKEDIFVRSLAAGTTALVSTASGGQANGDSFDPTLSDDGSKLAFESGATNLVPADADAATDVFVRDLASGTNTLVSTAAGGGAGGAYFDNSDISGNGNCVVYYTESRDASPAGPRSDFGRGWMRTVARECPVDPPDTSITSGPPALTKSKTPQFVFTSNDSGATFQCALDAAVFAACSSPFTSSPVADGLHTLTVRAVDAAGYVDATPATRSWTTDTTPPKLNVVVPKQRLRTVLRRGLRVILSCSERCTARSALFRGKKGVGKATVRLAGAGKKTFRIKLSRKAKKALKHSRSVKLKLRTTAVDQVGNRSRTNTRAVRLRR